MAKQLLFLSITLVIILSSCVSEDLSDATTHNKEAATVTFALKVPGTSSPTTRAGLSEIDETNVETIDILLFRKDGSDRLYWDKVQGVTIDNSPGSTKSFKADIPVGVYNNYDITVIANGRAQVAAAMLTRGDTKNAALDKLVLNLPFNSKWDSNKIPMWGEALNVDVNEGSSLSGNDAVKMNRMLSRIDVKLSKKAATGSDLETATGNTNFELSSARLYNYSTKGTLVPDLASGWFAGDASRPAKATSPHQPTGGYGKAQYDTYQPLVYLSADQHATAMNLPDSLIRAIYTLEAPAGSSSTLTTNTCLVIGGKFKGGSESFYRVDFAVKNQSTQKYDYIALLRNHRYIINIAKISGQGSDTPEQAFNALPVNIEANVLEWNDGEMGEVVIDGQYMLSVSKSEFNFSLDQRTGEEEDNVLRVYTDYLPSGWKIEKIVDASNVTMPVNWLTLSATSGAAMVKTKSVLTFTENNTAAERAALVIIAAGRLRYTVKVTQGVMSEIGVNIIDPISGTTLNELVFATVKDIQPATQSFRVDFAPKSSDLAVSTSMVGVNQAFTFNAGSNVISNATLSGLNGTISYNIQPTTITSSDVSTNPFMERTSKIDFTVSNGLAYESKSIFLRQFIYNTVVTTASGYMLDNSKTHSFTVRSNTQWKISDISDPDGLLDITSITALMNQSGGFTTAAEGQSVYFKFISNSDGTKEGKSVTLTLSDPTSHMNNVQVVLKTIECGSNGVATKQRIGANEYLTYKYNGKCWMVENLREGSIPAAAAGMYFNNEPEKSNGYYYTRAQANNNPCPLGWHLPTSAEASTLKTTISNNVNATHSKWWVSYAGISNGAFAGYFSDDSRWLGWNGTGTWWYGTADDYLFGTSANGFSSGTSFNFWASIRCVQN